MTIAGIDGCKGGWLCIEELHDGLRAFIASNIRDVVDQLPPDSLLGIDIPIGLPNDDSRQCDIEARQLLGPRGVCVFPAPLRVTVENTTDATLYEAANQIQRLHHAREKGISQQAWRILPKIREVDVFLRADGSGPSEFSKCIRKSASLNGTAAHRYRAKRRACRGELREQH